MYVDTHTHFYNTRESKPGCTMAKWGEAFKEIKRRK